MTKTYTVTAVDTTGIQNYIFGSNRLQENIGASELVRLATGQWALEEVQGVAKDQNNVDDAETGKLKDAFAIDQTTGDAAEVIYTGGGNVVVIFSGLSLAKQFTRALTSRVLRDAPGLSLVVAHSKLDWNEVDLDPEQSLSHVVTDLLNNKLAARKASRLPSMPLLGVGVTASCDSTGLPATKKQKESEDAEEFLTVSTAVAAKLDFAENANKRLEEEFEEELGGANGQRNWYQFPFKIDSLGRVSGEESYVAVVHADGNRMGDIIKRIADDHRTSAQNRQYINAQRAFSRQVNEGSKLALRHLVQRLTKHITWQRRKDELKEVVAARIPMEGTFLPFRPLVFGGDDVTFVCNGLVGVTLAIEYLSAFEQEMKRRKAESKYVEGLCASAGIAIVKMHYPFSRAYKLSEELAKEAKRFVWKEFGEDQDASAFDWHIATSGLSGSLRAIRQREFINPDDEKWVGAKMEKVPTLLMRPLLLGKDAERLDGRTWVEQIGKAVKAFQEDKKWTTRRNKVKDLREKLREGRDAVREFCKDFAIPDLPEIVRGDVTHQQTGWFGMRSTHFDAIELADYYLPLTELDDKPQEGQAR
ncbi:MAG: hypothetical protein JNJ50_19820 [Acidobacteria bacterium]|nr:hypothetical protein [Acidobacteriota bacterium]